MSGIFVEKMEHVPGIYMIFNLKSKKIYIGKAKRLKERALQHVKNLYFKCDNNKKLQHEFTNESNIYYLGNLCELENLENLDELESIYYLAACEECGAENVYNEKKLYNAKDRVGEIDKAKTEIKNALLRKIENTDGNMYKNCYGMKDWIDSKTVEKLDLKGKSIEQMLKNKEIDYLIFGKAGDYIGKNGMAQTLTSILDEKVNELKGIENIENKRCLWATSGPTLNDFSDYISLYKESYGNDKKLFVLFKLTVNSYNQNNKVEQKYFWEKDGEKYLDTAPARKNVKALVLKNFYIIKDDFVFESFAKMYYRFSSAGYRSADKKYELNSDILNRQTLYLAVKKSLILDEENEKLRNTLGFLKAPYLLDELREKYEAEEANNIIFTSDEEHPAYYLLAEVEDYVKLQRCN